MYRLKKYIDFSAVKRKKKLSLEEQAAVIIMSENGTIDEKIQDLKALLNAYEGGALQICEDIKCVIQLWKDILADRFCREGVVFLAALQEKNREMDSLPAYRFFSTYQMALEFLMREKESYQISKNLRNIETYAEIWRMELDSDDPNFDVYYFDQQMKLNRIVCCSDRAQKVSMCHIENAYAQLCEQNFYDVEHTLSFDDVVDDLTAICRKNGGVIN